MSLNILCSWGEKKCMQKYLAEWTFRAAYTMTLKPLKHFDTELKSVFTESLC